MSTKKEELVKIITKCEYDPLYKRALELLRSA